MGRKKRRQWEHLLLPQEPTIFTRPSCRPPLTYYSWPYPYPHARLSGRAGTRQTRQGLPTARVKVGRVPPEAGDAEDGRSPFQAVSASGPLSLKPSSVPPLPLVTPVPPHPGRSCGPHERLSSPTVLGEDPDTHLMMEKVESQRGAATRPRSHSKAQDAPRPPISQPQALRALHASGPVSQMTKVQTPPPTRTHAHTPPAPLPP